MRATFCLTFLLAFGSLFAFNPTLPPAICLSCNVPDGLAVSDLTGASAHLSWNAVNGSSQYTIEIESEQNTPTFHVETTITGNFYNVIGVQGGGLYKFKVRARCGNDKSNWSEWKFFNATGGPSGGGGSCGVVTGLSALINGDTATLHWNSVSGALQYYLEIEDEENASSNFHLEINLNDTTFRLTDLLPGVLYKFKVRNHCAHGDSTWSDWVFFNGNGSGNNGGGNNNGGNGTCTKPSNLHVLNITAISALLTWDSVPGVTSYTLEIEGNQLSPTPLHITQTVTTHQFLLTGLVANRRYKFKVRTNCSGGGHSDWSEWVKFKSAPNFQQAAEDRGMDSFSKTEVNLQVWPNPAQAVVSVFLQNLKGESTDLRLFDLSGHLMLEQNTGLEIGEGTATFSTSELPNGLYFLQMHNDFQTKTIKLVVSH